MNELEVSRLLAKVTAYDKRTVGKADILAWHEALSTVEVADALEAVARHYRDSTEFIMPAHVRRIVRTVREDRARGTSAALALPAKPSPEEQAAIDYERRREAGLSQAKSVMAQIQARLAAQRRPSETAATPSDLLLQRARERAAAERRGRTYTPEPLDERN